MWYFAWILGVTLAAALAERIARRVKARARFADDPAPWQAGDLVRVERIVTPRPGQLDAIMQAPLYALLDGPAESPALWHGWLAAAETDYAGWWDFVLQEQDLPFDPEAAMIQLWNPVRVYTPMIATRVGRLAPARLQAVRALAGEYVRGETPAAVPVWPGHVASRPTLHQLPVVTGSPLGGEDDPRHAYQHLYYHAAEALRLPAQLAVAALEDTPASLPTSAAAFIQHLLDHGRALGAALLASPRLAVPMHDGEPLPKDLIWADTARIRLDEIHADGAGCILLWTLGPDPLTAELHVDGVLAQRHQLQPDHAPLPLCWEPADAVSLHLRVPATGLAIELPFNLDRP